MEMEDETCEKESNSEKQQESTFQRRISNRHINTRLFLKNGDLNLHIIKRPNKYIRYTKDFANTLVALRWRWVILLVVVTNFMFYAIFSGFWALDAWLSGDFSPNKTSQYCIEGTTHYTGYLLLSIETITTTGYGFLYPTESCRIFWITMTLSTVVMIFLDGALVSVLFLKICKPIEKNYESIFSKKAVVTMNFSIAFLYQRLL